MASSSRSGRTAVGFIYYLHLVGEDRTGLHAGLFPVFRSWDAEDSMGRKSLCGSPGPDVYALKDSTAQPSPCELVSRPFIG